MPRYRGPKRYLKARNLKYLYLMPIGPVLEGTPGTFILGPMTLLWAFKWDPYLPYPRGPDTEGRGPLAKYYHRQLK